MNPQISRDSHDPQKRYSGVYQQQGRMLTDADWNELVEIVKARVDEAVAAIVGSGSPRNNDGEVPKGILRKQTIPYPVPGVPDLVPQPVVGERGVIATESSSTTEILGSSADLLDSVSTFESINNKTAKRVSNTPVVPSPEMATYKLGYGEVYVEGIRAVIAPKNKDDNPEYLDFNNQADLPLPEKVIVTDDATLYVDLWERNISCLEDSTLRDPGLPSGADTCTRTQTMAQVKLYTGSVNFQTIPRSGNALFTLKRINEAASVNPLENCLFRLEVHDFKQKEGTSKLILKWSTENGAEQYPYSKSGDKEPKGFKETKWVYELFSTISEKHHGVFLEGMPDPKRGQLTSPDGNTYRTFDKSSLDELAEFVRRWNGYCEVEKTGTGEWKYVNGYHCGTALNDKASEMGTSLKITGGKLVITMSDLNLQCSLTLQEKLFVPGDYWHGVIRNGTITTPEDSSSRGILHRYLKLGSCTLVNGKLFLTSPDPETLRKLSFPKLSELTADRIGFTPEENTENNTNNVQDALNKKVDVDGDVRMKGPFEMDGPLSIGCETNATKLRVKKDNDNLAGDFMGEVKIGNEFNEAELNASLCKEQRYENALSAGNYIAINKLYTRLDGINVLTNAINGTGFKDVAAIGGKFTARLENENSENKICGILSTSQNTGKGNSIGIVCHAGRYIQDMRDVITSFEDIGIVSGIFNAHALKEDNGKICGICSSVKNDSVEGYGGTIGGNFKIESNKETKGINVEVDYMCAKNAVGINSSVRTNRLNNKKNRLICGGNFSAYNPNTSEDETNSNSASYGIISQAASESKDVCTIGILASATNYEDEKNAFAAMFYGNVQIKGTLELNGLKNFVIDHPLDKDKMVLRHCTVESPEALCLYRGVIEIGLEGSVLVNLPNYFTELTKEEEATIYLTSVGNVPSILSYEWETKNSAFRIYGKQNGKASYIVLSERDDDAYKQFKRPIEEMKPLGFDITKNIKNTNEIFGSINQNKKNKKL